jgi:hypothetical protein
MQAAIDYNRTQPPGYRSSFLWTWQECKVTYVSEVG